VYDFIRFETEGEYPVQVVCHVLGVSRSAYYAYRSGQSYVLSEAKERLKQGVKRVFDKHLSRYGTRRIVAELQDEGYQGGRHAVRRWLKEQSLKAIQPRSFVPKTTQTDPLKRRSVNLLLDLPPPDAPNKVYVGDITYIPMVNGNHIYLAVWMDLHSRYIVGWALKRHMQADLVWDALKQSITRRRPPNGIIIHSDGGGQYLDIDFRLWLNDNHILQSMTRKDNHYDNAHIESLFSRFKAELLQNGVFDSFENAHSGIFEYIEIYYNPIRRHSALGYVSPQTFEKQFYQKLKATI
jgi:transposase InsO family protein